MMYNICCVVVFNLLVVGIVRGNKDKFCDDSQQTIDIPESAKAYNYPYTVMVTQVEPDKEYISAGFVLNPLWVMTVATYLKSQDEVKYAIAGANRSVLPADFKIPLYSVELVKTMPQYIKGKSEAKFEMALLKLAKINSEIADPHIHLTRKPGVISSDIELLESVYWKKDGKNGFTKTKIHWCPKPSQFERTCMFKGVPYICLSTTLGQFEKEDPARKSFPCKESYSLGSPLVSKKEVYGMLLGIEDQRKINKLSCDWKGLDHVYYIFIHLSSVVSNDTPENNEVAEWLTQTMNKYGPFLHLSSTTERPKKCRLCQLTSGKEETPSNLSYLTLMFVSLFSFLF